MEVQTNHAGSRTAPALSPAVDIAEDAAGITLTADLPGVEKRDLAANIEGRTLDGVKQHGRSNDNHPGRLDGDECRCFSGS